MGILQDWFTDSDLSEFWQVLKLHTRQLSMGAGHCQWGGYTDGNVCNIHGEAHLASRWHVMLRS